ncbi:hypothetical protein SCOR_22600 [Sulfidibacter corallicola]|uniref:Uncharacterized protein n=1 Tax=Sulfidibacter corallicola TaxID=2818388 RepID=A0A8A4TUU1_SULCO|nr:hypothetical protein [Sulfidibacter corallicola]QTD52792.1 hypothetical protein J3U87_09975 [Sulfidibacter corallicola]
MSINPSATAQPKLIKLSKSDLRFIAGGNGTANTNDDPNDEASKKKVKVK